MKKLDHCHDRLDCMVPKPLELVSRRNIEKFGILVMKNPRILYIELGRLFWWELGRKA